MVIQSAPIEGKPVSASNSDSTADIDQPSCAIRLGFTVTKKTFKSAVKRNRVKRRLRALAREIITPLAKPGYDYVLIGRPATLDTPYDVLKKDLKWCLKRMDKLK